MNARFPRILNGKCMEKIWKIFFTYLITPNTYYTIMIANTFLKWKEK